MTDLDYAPLTSAVKRRDVVEFLRAKGQSPAWLATAQPWILAGLICSILLGHELMKDRSEYSTGLGLPLPVYVILFIGIWVYFGRQIFKTKRSESRHVRLLRFARANGLQFFSAGPIPQYPGMLFRLGSARQMPERLSRRSHPALDLGNFEYVTERDKSRITRTWGFMAIKLDRKLPHMVVDAKSNNTVGSNLPLKLSRDQVLFLEGQFDESFTLYCPKRYEQDALYVFTPDLMARLIDDASLLDIEIIDDWMFFYSDQPFDLTDAHTIDRMFGVAESVGTATKKGTARYADDRAVDTTSESAPTPLVNARLVNARLVSNAIAPQGRRLKPRMRFFKLSGSTLMLIVPIATILYVIGNLGGA